MKNKKLEKKTLFVFKKTNFTHLTKEQMRKINGGDGTNGGGYSGNPQCDELKTAHQTVSD